MKTKASHTPGPWGIYTNLEVCKFPEDGNPAYRSTICKVMGDDGIANSRLIAAAPEMYDFIKRLAEGSCYENPGEFPEEGETGIAPCLTCQAREIIRGIEK